MKKNLIKIFTAALLSSAIWCEVSHADEGEFQYEIKQKPGIIACSTKEDFGQIVKYSAVQDAAGAEGMLNSQKCFYLIRGKDIYAAPGVCDPQKNKGADLVAFRPRGMTKMVYLPCFATWEAPAKPSF